MKIPNNRMAVQQTRLETPPTKIVEPVEMVQPTQAKPVAKCKKCGAAWANLWETRGGGAYGTYKRCRSCGSNWVFINDTMRLLS